MFGLFPEGSEQQQQQRKKGIIDGNGPHRGEFACLLLGVSIDWDAFGKRKKHKLLVHFCPQNKNNSIPQQSGVVEKGGKRLTSNGFFKVLLFIRLNCAAH